MSNSASRKEITAHLSALLEMRIAPNNDARSYWAREVTIGYGSKNQMRVDYMEFEPKNNTVSGIEKGDFYVYEIKSSVADFNSPNGHNMIGDFNYYVMPHDVFEAVKKKIPREVGVLCPAEEQAGECLKSYKTSKRIDREYSLIELLLMMFRSCARDRKVT